MDCLITFMWYAITFLIYFDISFDFGMKKKVYLLQENQKGKKKKKMRSETNSKYSWISIVNTN